MNRNVAVLFMFVALCALVVSASNFKINSDITKERNIPLVIDPSFLQKVSDCGKLDLIDRASPKYNEYALVDGSLKECGN